MRHPHSPQRGLSLIFALLALVALSLGAVALLRSVDTGTRVLGNLGFKRDATMLADGATEDAIAWLVGCSGQTGTMAGCDLTKDAGGLTGSNGQGYFASSHDTLDPSNQKSGTYEYVNWDGDSCGGHSPCITPTLTHTWQPASGQPSHGYTQYAIFRLCSATITDDSGCLKPSSTPGSSAKRGKLDYGDYARFTTPPGPYYRIVVRSVSADRQTTSFTETIVHF